MTISTQSLLNAGYRQTNGSRKGVNHERSTALWQKAIADEKGVCFFLSFFEFQQPHGACFFHCEACFTHNGRPIMICPSIGNSGVEEIEDQMLSFWKSTGSEYAQIEAAA